MKACTLFTSDNEVAEDWLGKFNSRDPLDIYGQKYLIDEISTDYEPGFSGATIKMYPVYQVKSPERPKKQGAWNGNGKPPIGIECELHHSTWAESHWEKRVILYAGDSYLVTTEIGCDDERSSYIREMTFRPIKTAEQIAAEKRENAVNEMVDSLNRYNSIHEACGMLYDCGYRKQ